MCPRKKKNPLLLIVYGPSSLPPPVDLLTGCLGSDHTTLGRRESYNERGPLGTALSRRAIFMTVDVCV